MAKDRLSDAQIRKAAPAERDYKLFDGGGLYLLVRTNGSKLWRHKYRTRTKKERLLSYGAYPEVSLAAARKRRDESRRIQSDGRDPAIEKKRAVLAARIAEAHSFETIARQWHELNKGRWTPRHAADVLTSLERDAFPALGERPIAEIEAYEVLDVLQSVERRGSIETASRLRQRISAVFVYGKARRLCKDDPASDLAAALKPKPKSRRQPAILDLERLRALLTKTEQSGAYPLTLLASRLLALTAVRPGVVRGAVWTEFEAIDWSVPAGPDTHADALWRVPAERMKLVLERKDEEAFEHLVPLPWQAVAVLQAARRLSGNCELVFPGQRHAHIPLSENAIGYLYNREGYKGQHVPHGWRAAFSTIMNERYERAWRASGHSGASPDRAIIDLMLAHVPKDKVEGAYNRAQFMERRREIAQDWAGLLLEGVRPAGDLLLFDRRRVGQTA